MVHSWSQVPVNHPVPKSEDLLKTDGVADPYCGARWGKESQGRNVMHGCPLNLPYRTKWLMFTA